MVARPNSQLHRNGLPTPIAQLRTQTAVSIVVRTTRSERPQNAAGLCLSLWGLSPAARRIVVGWTVLSFLSHAGSTSAQEPPEAPAGQVEPEDPSAPESQQPPDSPEPEIESTPAEDAPDGAAPDQGSTRQAPSEEWDDWNPFEEGSSETSSDEPTDEESPRAVSLRANLELGLLGVLYHHVQLGRDGTSIDYRDDAGQDILFPFWRASVDVTLFRRHIVTLLYQPLDFDTRELLPRDIRLDGLELPAGTPLQARYQFPYYRLGWAYDLLPADDSVLAVGIGLQIRNANIEFQSLDGTQFRRRSDVGLVPLLRVRGHLPVSEQFWLGFDADGFYAPISGLNLSDRDVLGVIADVGVQFGWRGTPFASPFLGVRYIGGGSRGEGDPTPTSDGWQSNWLHFLAVTLGIAVGN